MPTRRPGPPDAEQQLSGRKRQVKLGQSPGSEHGMDDLSRNSQLDSRAFASAVLLEKVIRDAYDKRRSTEVQPLQWSIMRYLSMASAERCTIVWIASFLGVTHAPVVRAVKTLTQRNFVQQQDNPADGRSKIICLTEVGLNQLNADPLLQIAERIDELAEHERNILISAIRQLMSQGGSGKETTDGVNPSG